MCLCSAGEGVSALISVLLLPFHIQPLWTFHSQPSLLRVADVLSTDVLYTVIMICSRFPRSWRGCSHTAIATKLQNTIVTRSFYSLPEWFSVWCLHTTMFECTQCQKHEPLQPKEPQKPHSSPLLPQIWFHEMTAYLKSQPTFLDHAIGSQTYAAVLKQCLCFCFCLFSVAGSVWDFWNCVNHSVLEKGTVVKWYRVVDFKACHVWIG